MSEGSNTSGRSWLRLGLLTLFVLATIGGLWIGYYAHWKNERREARAWIDAHQIGGSIGYHPEARPGLPWMLGLLGDKAETIILMIHEPTRGSSDRAPAEYKRLVERVTSLFPEAQIIDLSAFEPQAEQTDEVP